MVCQLAKGLNKMITWSPDTCGCKFEVINQENFNCKPIKKCDVHSNITDDQIMNVVHVGENQAKNQLLGIIREELGINAKDNERNDLIGFEFDERRNIIFKIKEMKPAQRIAIMARLAKHPFKDKLKDLQIKE